MITLLAFDTATEHMSIALGAHGEVWVFEAVGGVQASATLIPSIMKLLAEADIRLSALDAIAFGRGPGAFTGLRTACSVAQGLAFGAGKPVLPVDSLLAVAEDARTEATSHRVWVTMDARMNEIYAAHYAFAGDQWQTLAPPMLTTAAALNERWRVDEPEVVAGTALGVFGEQLCTGGARLAPHALPRARAMLPLAQRLWQQGGAVDAALALPVYVRDKVAQTTAEREAQRTARAA